MVLLRCKLDGLLLDAHRHPTRSSIVVYDGDESFEMERLEASYYEIVAACREDIDWLERAGYRCLRLARDFQLIAQRLPA